MTRAPSTAVAWFRRDLRVHDHPGLLRAVECFDRVAPVFVVDEALIAGRHRSPNRTWFMVRSVAALAASLGDLGADLTVLRGDPAVLIPRFAADVGAREVIVSRDYAPYGRRRDAAVERASRAIDIDLVAEPGLLVHEPEAVRRSDGGPFSVFSPFHRAWEALERRPVLGAPSRIAGVRRPAQTRETIADLLWDVHPTADPDLIPEPGEPSARRRLEEWSRSRELAEYAVGRDRLDRPGTSRLSQDLRWGLLSPVEVLSRAHEPDPQRFRAEIAWRDFYAHLLWNRPSLARESLRPEFRDLPWRADEGIAEAWRQGRTGVPVIDAAMRQLAAAGWMSNRARMIVASFLTKQLGIDWRVGAAHFMEHLVDGDIASNAGGWQWAASTGTDAQPWFRMFNPVRQARRFDPGGEYVRRWLPELAARADLPGPAVHEPPDGAYLEPLVDLPKARERALTTYRDTAFRARPSPVITTSPEGGRPDA